MEDSERTEADVNEVLEYAKLERKDLLPIVQCIGFSDQLDNDVIKMIELSGDMVDQLKAGDRLVIRGTKDDSTVICTKNKTYDMKEADTSNSLLIIPDVAFPETFSQHKDTTMLNLRCRAVMYTYYELKECRPKLKRIKKMLEENMFSGQCCEEDEEHQGKKYTYKDLVNVVQASESQINAALSILQACQIDDHMRLLDFDYLSNVMSQLLRLVDEESWGLDAIPIQACYDTLQELFPRSVIKHVLTCYADKLEEEEKQDSGGLYKLSEDKVCRYYAELLLRVSGKFHLQEFEQVWQQSVPEGMNTSLLQLEGLALIDRSSKPEVIELYRVIDLPEDVEERFNTLFRRKPKWSQADITPYIQDLATEKIKVGALLTKYCRAMVKDGIKMYNSKKTST